MILKLRTRGSITLYMVSNKVVALTRCNVSLMVAKDSKCGMGLKLVSFNNFIFSSLFLTIFFSFFVTGMPVKSKSPTVIWATGAPTGFL